VKGWQVLALLLVFILLFPLCVKFVTGSWLMDYFIPPTTGATFVGAVVGGESSRGTYKERTPEGLRSFVYPYIEEYGLACRSWKTLKTEVSGRFFMNWGWWDSDKVDWTARIGSVADWSSYGVVLPGDLTRPLSMGSVKPTEWINTSNLTGNWESFLSALNRQLGFSERFESFLEDPLRALEESFSSFLWTEYQGSITYLGVTEVPIYFTFDKPRPADDGYGDGNKKGDARHPTIILDVVINLSPDVVQRAGIPTPDNVDNVVVLGLFGKDDTFWEWLGVNPPVWLRYVNNLSDELTNRIVYIEWQTHEFPEATVEEAFGIPTGVSWSAMPAGLMDEGKFWLDIESRRISNHPSAILVTIRLEFGDLPAGSEMRFRVKIPVLWAAVYRFNYSLGDYISDSFWNWENLNIPKIDLENLIEPWEYRWEEIAPEVEIENMFESMPPPVSVDELVENLPTIVIPEMPKLNNVPIVTYQVGSALPMMYASTSEPVSAEKPFVEPYLIDVAVVLVFIFAILGVLIWFRL